MCMGSDLLYCFVLRSLGEGVLNLEFLIHAPPLSARNPP